MTGVRDVGEDMLEKVGRMAQVAPAPTRTQAKTFYFHRLQAECSSHRRLSHMPRRIWLGYPSTLF